MTKVTIPLSSLFHSSSQLVNAIPLYYLLSLLNVSQGSWFENLEKSFLYLPSMFQGKVNIEGVVQVLLAAIVHSTQNLHLLLPVGDHWGVQLIHLR